ncbi:MAG: flagellar export chaperone FliS [Desulfotalea sp.]
MSTHLNQYQKNQIETASPEQILLMLYDGAIRFIRRAIVGLETGDMKEVRFGVNKTHAIISEFSNTLDRELGGKIAEDLDALYFFMLKELNSVTIEPDLQKMKDVEKLLVDLRATWGEAVEINKKEKLANKEQQLSPPKTIPQVPIRNPVATGYGAAGNALPQTYSPISIAG